MLSATRRRADRCSIEHVVLRARSAPQPLLAVSHNLNWCGWFNDVNDRSFVFNRMIRGEKVWV